MKRKPQVQPTESPVVDMAVSIGKMVPEIPIEKPKTEAKCSVCGAQTTSGLPEQLCWVCRRLKISAWRDVEQQMPVQE